MFSINFGFNLNSIFINDCYLIRFKSCLNYLDLVEALSLFSIDLDWDFILIDLFLNDYLYLLFLKKNHL